MANRKMPHYGGRGGPYQQLRGVRQHHRPQLPSQSIAPSSPPVGQHHAPMGYVSGQSLQSHPFPGCVTDALSQIVAFVRQHGLRWTRVKVPDIQARIDVDLFCLSADKATSRLTELQKLKLIGILCTFFKENSGDSQLRHIYFDVIFGGREGETQLHETRINFLTNYSPMFLQYPVYAIFEDIAIWLNRLGASRPYGERIVAELCDKFLLVPPSYAMHEYLQPLFMEAPNFACIFVVHSLDYLLVGDQSKENEGGATAEAARVALVELLGEWLSAGWFAFLQTLSEATYLAEKFANKSFPPALTYDSTNQHRSDAHERFHFVITTILLNWKNIFPKTISASTGVLQLKTACLLDIIATEDRGRLDGEAGERLIHHLKSSLIAGSLTKQMIQSATAGNSHLSSVSDVIARLLNDF